MLMMNNKLNIFFLSILLISIIGVVFATNCYVEGYEFMDGGEWSINKTNYKCDNGVLKTKLDSTGGYINYDSKLDDDLVNYAKENNYPHYTDEEIQGMYTQNNIINTEQETQTTPKAETTADGVVNQANWNTGKAAGVAFGAGTAAGAASSYLFNSLLGSDDPAKQQYQAGLSGVLGGVGGALGAIGGPLFSGIGGFIGSWAGSMIGAAIADNDTIKSVDRVISFDSYYVRIFSTDSIALNEPLFKLMGDVGNDKTTGTKTSIGWRLVPEGRFLKEDNGNTIAIYPIGFNKTTETKDLDPAILFVNYDKLDVNKISEMIPKEKKRISWDDAKSQSKVDAKDDDVVNVVRPASLNKNYRNDETISFSLIFRDVNKESMTFALPNMSCFRWDGVTGATGKEAVPKVSFNWEYSSSDRKCSEDKIYCDATQFTLEVLSRLESAKSFFSGKDGSDLQNTSSYVESYSLSPEIPDVYVPVNVTGSFGEKTFSMVIENKKEEILKGHYVVYIKNTETNTDTLALEDDFELAREDSTDEINPKTVSQLNLAVSRYRIKMVLTIGQDANKSQYVLYSNIFDLHEKNVLTTSDEVLRAYETSGDRPNYKLLHFKANLMADGYTNDFLLDFKDYALYQRFMGSSVPEKLIDTLIPEKIEFLPKTGQVSSPQGFKLSNAGEYNVSIVVKYKDSQESLAISNTEGLAENVEKVYVYLEPTLISYNPLYYMPLNSTVGVVNGTIAREGYGVDFEEDPQGGMIQFNNNTNELLLISPSLSSQSNPLIHLQLAREDNSMEVFNNTRRGIVLNVSSAGLSGGTITRRIEFMPNLPYPVKLNLHKETEGDAFGIYTISSENGPVNTGSRLFVWSQFCGDSEKDFEDYDCEYLNGEKPVDHQADNDSIAARLNAPSGQSAALSYGIEVDKDAIIRDGEHTDIYMRSILYGAKKQNYRFSATPGASDKLLVGTFGENYGSDVSLETPFTESLTTIQDVYEKVEDGWLCVSGTENGKSISFWWNPAKVYDPSYDPETNIGETTN